MDFQAEMNRVVQGFVSQIAALARQAALDTLGAAFSQAQATPSTGSSLNAPAASRPGRPAGGRGAKRTQADIEAMSSKVVAFIKAHPGLRIEQINKELGTTTKDLALPLRKLVSDKVLATKGQKRATTYFPGRKA